MARASANPFDYGAGHIVPNDALNPGLVYDVSDDEFDAFACGTESPAVAESRCDELEGAGVSFAPEDLNQPSIGLARLANEQTVSRPRHECQRRIPDLRTASPSRRRPGSTGNRGAPSSLSLGPGQTATFDVSASSTNRARSTCGVSAR